MVGYTANVILNAEVTKRIICEWFKIKQKKIRLKIIKKKEKKVEQQPPPNNYACLNRQEPFLNPTAQDHAAQEPHPIEGS